MNRSIKIAYVERLKMDIAKLNDEDSLHSLLALHFDHERQLETILNKQIIIPSLEHWYQTANNLRDTPTLAFMGAVLSLQQNAPESIEKEAYNAFAKHVMYLQSREDVFSFQTSWIYQPDIVLGIILGLSTIEDNKLISWFKDLLIRGLSEPIVPTFVRLTYIYGISLLGKNRISEELLSISMNEIAKYTIGEIAFIIWLADIGVFEDINIESLRNILQYRAENEKYDRQPDFTFVIEYYALRHKNQSLPSDVSETEITTSNEVKNYKWYLSPESATLGTWIAAIATIISVLVAIVAISNVPQLNAPTATIPSILVSPSTEVTMIPTPPEMTVEVTEEIATPISTLITAND